MKKPIMLNLGCGVSLADDFINVDNFFDLKDLKRGVKTKEGVFRWARVPKGVKFVKGDMCNLPFKDNFADYIECNDAIEHMSNSQIIPALKEMYRVLKPGGKLGLETTNFDELARLWTEKVTGKTLSNEEDMKSYIVLSQVIYGHQASLGEYHKVPFNPFSLGYYLHAGGFTLENIKITIYPTHTPERPPQLAYKHLEDKLEGSVMLTEMLWAEAIK